MSEIAMLTESSSLTCDQLILARWTKPWQFIPRGRSGYESDYIDRGRFMARYALSGFGKLSL